MSVKKLFTPEDKIDIRCKTNGSSAKVTKGLYIYHSLVVDKLSFRGILRMNMGGILAFRGFKLPIEFFELMFTVGRMSQGHNPIPVLQTH